MNCVDFVTSCATSGINACVAMQGYLQGNSAPDFSGFLTKYLKKDKRNKRKTHRLQAWCARPHRSSDACTDAATCTKTDVRNKITGSHVGTQSTVCQQRLPPQMSDTATTITSLKEGFEAYLPTNYLVAHARAHAHWRHAYLAPLVILQFV